MYRERVRLRISCAKFCLRYQQMQELRDKMEGHRKRLREKFIRAGISGFHDYEIVELLLTLGTPRKIVNNRQKKL